MISLYARGMSTRDIHDQLKDLYGVELSAEMVSKITDRIFPRLRNGRLARSMQSIPLCLWTASIIRCGRRGGY